MAGASPAPDFSAYPPLDGASRESKRDLGKKNPSWAEVTQSSSGLIEHELIYGSAEGRDFVEVSDTIVQNKSPLWEDLVEGKFLDLAPHVGKIHAIVNRIWPLGNQSIKIDVFEVDKTTVKFRIRDANTRSRILRRGMWNIANIPMIVSRWLPEEEETEEVEIKSIPMWVILKNVPRRLFSWEGLGFIASAVGKPKRLHPDTIICKSFEEAKVFVEADMTKELPKSRNFKSKLGFEAEVKFEYPWLPSKCSLCEKWGHISKTCSGKGKSITLLKRNEGSTSEAAKELDLRPSVAEEEVSRKMPLGNPQVPAILPTDEVTEAVAEEASRDETTEAVAVETSKDESTVVVAMETSREESTVSGEITKNLENDIPEVSEQEWSTVSPTKQARSASLINSTSTTISSPSRFAILGLDHNVSTHLPNEIEEGELREDTTLDEGEYQDLHDQSTKDIKDEGNSRRISTRTTKQHKGQNMDGKAPGTSSVTSTMGKRRNQKKSY